MPASITEFVDINLTVADASAEKFSFGSLLGLFEHTVTANRQDGPFYSLAEGVAAGFTSTAAPDVYAWLTAVFSQENGTERAIVGRKIASGGDPVGYAVQTTAIGPAYSDQTVTANDVTAANLVLFPTAEAIADWFAVGHNEPFSVLTFDAAGGTAGVGGVVAWEYWNGVTWSALSVVDGTTGFTAGASDGQQVDITVPLDWARTTINGSASLYFVRARITTVYTTNPIYDQAFVGGDASAVAALDAVEAYDNSSFYLVDVPYSRSAATINAVAAWAEAKLGDDGVPKFFVAQSYDSDFLNGTGGNIGELMQTANYKQSALIFHSDDTEHLSGAWSSKGGGFNLDAPAGGNGGARSVGIFGVVRCSV